jgi:hypothetical protein
MTWNLTLWGTETPTRRRKLAMTAGFIAVGLMWHALLVDFVPAGGTYSVAALSVFAVMGVAASGALVYGNHRMGRLHGRRGFGILCGALIFAPVFALMAWLVVAKSGGALVTSAVGESYSRTIEGDVIYRWRRRKCDYFIEVQAGGAQQDRTYCVSERFFAHYGGQRVRARLFGERSFMGVRIAGVDNAVVVENRPGESR